MDLFLDKITQQAVNYAIRSGVTLTASYALRQTGKLMGAIENSSERDELQVLQDKLQSKIRIISPAIDMIELISARGNTTLESAIELTSRLRSEITMIAQRLEKAVASEDLARRGSSKAPSKIGLENEIRGVIKDLKRLLSQIEDAVPFLNLALTTSGAKLSTDLPPSISPSRLLQASTFLTAADSRYASQEVSAVQVGPTFTLSLYMLFAGHIRPQDEDDVRASTWKEVIHKARLKLMRIPFESLGQPIPPDTNDGKPLLEQTSSKLRTANIADEYAYQLLLIEDFDDDRMHDFEGDELQPEPFAEIASSGIKEAVPIHEVAKIFYADTGKILNIGSDEDLHRPVLLLKRNKEAIAPRRITSRVSPQSYEAGGGLPQGDDPENSSVQSALDAQLGNMTKSNEAGQQDAKSIEGHNWQISSDLDPEWLALEVYMETSDSDSDSDDEEGGKSPSVQKGSRSSRGRDSLDPDVLSRLADMNINSPARSRQTDLSKSLMLHHDPTDEGKPVQDPALRIRTSLSLLEVLLRLTSLQQFQQETHLSIKDEFLNFFLSESASTGVANGDEHERRALREDARRRVGFDPYDESPIKRRGEDYQYGEVSGQVNKEDGQEVAQSPRATVESPRNQNKRSSLGHSRHPSKSDYPPMRLKNSPQRSSRQGTPEGSHTPTTLQSPGKPSRLVPLTMQDLDER